MLTAQLEQTKTKARRKGPEAMTEAQLLAMPEADYMNDAQLGFFRLKLRAMLADIGEHAKNNIHSATQVEVTADPSDRATAEEEKSQALRSARRDADKRTRLEAALESITSGDYGWCAETGEAIGIERLLAQPTATLSIEAQSRRELQAKYRN